jgi:NAD(P)-dependent dehydrogenase (short-subunit alcohol dehydrogenase family)
MSNEFKDKVALITGAGSGMGRATALKFAAAGAKVMLADIDEAGGVATRAAISDAGGEADFSPTDVTCNRSVQALVDNTLTRFGRLDCAFNNAGVACTAPDREIAINLKGVFLSMKHELPVFLDAGGGCIVNTLSVLGLIGAPRESSYVASKHGACGLTKSAALDYARLGIRINGICPGAIDTPMLASARAAYPDLGSTIPIGRLGHPDEIANTVLWLCSSAASYITGQCLGVDGGMFTR